MNIPEILGKCEPVGACVLWTSYCDQRGVPRIGKPRKSLRRMIYEFYAETKLPNDLRVTLTCAHPNCLNFGHMRARRPSAYLKGIKKSAQAVVNMTLARRARSRLSIQMVRQVREDLSAKMTTHAAAKKHGISQALCSRIGRNEVWRDEAMRINR